MRELFAIRRASTYKADCSDIIDEVIDLGTAYNSQSNPSAPDPESAAYVQDAINVLQAKWRSNFATWNFEMRNRRQSDSASSDGTLKILNTRLLYVDSNTANQELYEEYFKDVKVIVEFELYSDDYGSAPYYVNVARDNAVWIMEDGSVQMGRFTIFELLRKLGSYDFSTFGDLFTRIIDLGSACNETFTLLT